MEEAAFNLTFVPSGNTIRYCCPFDVVMVLYNKSGESLPFPSVEHLYSITRLRLYYIGVSLPYNNTFKSAVYQNAAIISEHKPARIPARGQFLITCRAIADIL